VLWVISHPEAVSTEECDEADLVLVASAPFADHLRSRTATPVAVLHQATDPAVFSPRPSDPRRRHELVVVANARHVLRPVVAAALDAGLRPAIYGRGWQGLVDPAIIASEHVANEELAGVYSSAELVLADHWETMRAWGFPGNRLFDVLACGTPVLSDDVPGIDELLAGAVPTWTDAEELGRQVLDRRHHPEAWRRRAAEGRRLVLGAHTIDHRAAELLELLDRHAP
jgi:spore maturation protein CgeB